MVSIMRHFKIEDWSITRLRQVRAGLTIHPLGPEFATMEALRLSFARFLRRTGRISEYPEVMDGEHDATCIHE